MISWLVSVKCRFCGRVHCEADAGTRVRFRCRKCKRMQTVIAGEPE